MWCRASAAPRGSIIPAKPFQPFADPLAEALDGAHGPAEPEADLRRRVALQAQLQDRPLLGGSGPEQVLDRLGQDGGLVRRRLPVRGQLPGLALPLWGRYLPLQAAPLGPEVLDPVGALAQGDEGQQTPQTVPVADSELALAVAEEEALVGRLHDVFRIDLVHQALVELPSRQADELSGEAL